MSKLVIVESPAKATTIKKYLGKGYEVMASMGHIRDLPQSSLGVNIKDGFKPQYFTMFSKQKLIKELRAAAEKSDEVLLATDPDREGEAISWHLAYVLGLSENEQNRVTFGEITEKGIKNGIAAPRKIDMDLVDAQQARRILDRIVGYKLSPFLWTSIKRGLSAGRVQSVALRIIVEREREIDAFIPEEYWVIEVLLSPKGMKKTFVARYIGKIDEAGEHKIENAEQAAAIAAELEDAQYVIDSIKRSMRKRTPEPPFITSTLQQDASRRLNFTARRTMRAAQELYEGVKVEGVGQTGLITYMRTDSLRISDEADAAVKAYIGEAYGSKYLCKYARKWKRKNATAAQDAHEAIRPTDVRLTPDTVKSSLTADQYKVYKLVWERFVASRMSDAQLEMVAVDISAAGHRLRANGHTTVFDGFTKLYEAATDSAAAGDAALPDMTEQTELVKRELTQSQKFTQPPARYTEASLIKTLEENGIGRPSTYEPTIGTIIDRSYVERNQKQLVPTQLGIVINDLMVEHFSQIVNVSFSSEMETNLDKIEDGKLNWTKALDDFYKDFEVMYAKAEKELSGVRIQVPEEQTDVICENCGRNMVIKTGRYGKFLACPGYPECKNTKRIVVETKGFCPKCGAKVVQRRSMKGRTFYACEKGKECGFMTWAVPTEKRCPTCGKSLFAQSGKLKCLDEACGYTVDSKK